SLTFGSEGRAERLEVVVVLLPAARQVVPVDRVAAAVLRDEPPVADPRLAGVGVPGEVPVGGGLLVVDRLDVDELVAAEPVLGGLLLPPPVLHRVLAGLLGPVDRDERVRAGAGAAEEDLGALALVDVPALGERHGEVELLVLVPLPARGQGDGGLAGRGSGAGGRGLRRGGARRRLGLARGRLGGRLGRRLTGRLVGARGRRAGPARGGLLRDRAQAEISADDGDQDHRGQGGDHRQRLAPAGRVGVHRGLVGGGRRGRLGGGFDARAGLGERRGRL